MGALNLTKLSPHTIQKFYNTLHRGKEGEVGVSPKTIKNIHGILHKGLKQALQLGYIKSNPSDICKLPKVIKKEIKPLEENDIALFLKAIKAHRFETLYMVDLFECMRQGEILGLKWDCVDFKKNYIY